MSDRERQTPYDLTYMCNIKNKINKTETDSETQRARGGLPEGKGAGGLGEKVKGLSSTNW